MARYAIVADKVFGDSVIDMRRLGRRRAAPRSGGAVVDDRLVRSAHAGGVRRRPGTRDADEMDRWTRDFDNWAICDHLTFHLFDRSPHAWRKVDQWAAKDAEFVERATFALLAALALHDKDAADREFVDRLPLIAAAATDPRNFVKKGVSWALRSIGSRNVVLHRGGDCAG